VVPLSREEREFLYKLSTLQNQYSNLMQTTTIMLSVALSLVSILVVEIVWQGLETQVFGLLFLAKLGIVVFVGFVVILAILYYRDRERDRLARLAEAIRQRHVW
jgi:sensor c-di-GMP phosphodiesterase-like protein